MLLPYDLNAALINTQEIQLPYLLLYLVCMKMFINRFLEIHLNIMNYKSIILNGKCDD